MRQILFKNQKKSKLYIYPKTNVITLLSLERSEALSSARLKILVRHLKRGAKKQSKSRDCFAGICGSDKRGRVVREPQYNDNTGVSLRGAESRSNLIYKEWVASPQLAATGEKDNLRITIKRS